MGNPVVHFEVTGPDLGTLTKFYGEMFGWNIQEIPDAGYAIVDTTSGSGINGGLGKSQDGSKVVTFYVAASNPQEILDKVEALGGKIALPLTEVPGMVTYAHFTDPEGNLIGLVKSAEQPDAVPGSSPGDNPAVEWFEVLGKDVEGLQKFYGELLGWKFKQYTPEVQYYEVDTGSEFGIRGGVGSGPEPEPHVTLYAKVDEVARWLKKAESLGAKVVMGPQEVQNDLVVGAFQDPQGTVFGVWGEK